MVGSGSCSKATKETPQKRILELDKGRHGQKKDGQGASDQREEVDRQDRMNGAHKPHPGGWCG